MDDNDNVPSMIGLWLLTVCGMLLAWGVGYWGGQDTAERYDPRAEACIRVCDGTVAGLTTDDFQCECAE